MSKRAGTQSEILKQSDSKQENKEVVKINKVKLLDLQSHINQLSSDLDFIPTYTNYLIENTIVRNNIVGTIIEHYEHPSESQTKLSDHLKLLGATQSDYIWLTEEQIKRITRN